MIGKEFRKKASSRKRTPPKAKGPGKKAPAKKKPPAKKAPVKKAPIKKAPVKKTPVKKRAERVSTPRKLPPRGRSPEVVPPQQARFLNREWSWLEFNYRVLEEAACEKNPLLERLKFLAIVASNLDEFYMVRVAGLRGQREAGDETLSVDGLRPSAQLVGVARRVEAMAEEHDRILRKELLPKLAKKGIRLVSPKDASKKDLGILRKHFDRMVQPILTPIAVDPTHPFPTLLNCHLYLAVRLRGQGPEKLPTAPLAFVEVPGVLPRFLPLPGEGQELRFCPLESLVTHFIEELFAGYEVKSVHPVRITRDADLSIDEEESVDLLQSMRDELLTRRRGAAVRLEYAADTPDSLLAMLLDRLEQDPMHAFPIKGLLQAKDLHQLVAAVNRPKLLDRQIAPTLPEVLGDSEDIFSAIRSQDIFLYHPYHAFDPVVELAARAANDPKVLAIKQTLYRTSGDSPIVAALARGARAGKQVTVLVELKARFDEERNIEWAEHLERAGCHVIYGLLGLKTHCKALLVVRKEADGIRRYVHLATGNYNDKTARLYTDMGLLTCDESLAEDVSSLFNVITGYSRPPRWNKLSMAPTGLRKRFLALIERETQKSTGKKPGQIVAKMNSLVDPDIIEALYRASCAGVQIDLIVRGICCLRPGMKKLSEHIRVLSIVGRYLEHARVFWFRNGGDPELYLSSADWMPRNLDRRIETLFPIESSSLRQEVKAILDLQLKDTVKARRLLPDGFYEAVEGKKRIDSQVELHELLKPSPRKKAASKGVFVPLEKTKGKKKK